MCLIMYVTTLKRHGSVPILRKMFKDDFELNFLSNQKLFLHFETCWSWLLEITCFLLRTYLLIAKQMNSKQARTRYLMLNNLNSSIFFNRKYISSRVWQFWSVRLTLSRRAAYQCVLEYLNLLITSLSTYTIFL